VETGTLPNHLTRKIKRGESSSEVSVGGKGGSIRFYCCSCFFHSIRSNVGPCGTTLGSGGPSCCRSFLLPFQTSPMLRLACSENFLLARCFAMVRLGYPLPGGAKHSCRQVASCLHSSGVPSIRWLRNNAGRAGLADMAGCCLVSGLLRPQVGHG